LNFSDEKKTGKDFISRKERQDLNLIKMGPGRGLCELSVLGAINFPVCGVKI
jgi:hypothetical protein